MAVLAAVTLFFILLPLSPLGATMVVFGALASSFAGERLGEWITNRPSWN